MPQVVFSYLHIIPHLKGFVKPFLKKSFYFFILFFFPLASGIVSTPLFGQKKTAPYRHGLFKGY